MDKSWMQKPRLSAEYRQRVYNFFEFASKKRVCEMLDCPCVKCVNSYVLSISEVFDHVMEYDFSSCYNH